MTKSQEVQVPKKDQMHRVGDWLPKDHRAHRQWLDGVIDKTQRKQKTLHPVIKEFQALIENDSRLYLLFSGMFDEIPKKKPYYQDPTGHQQIRSYKQMLEVMNYLIEEPPAWSIRAEVGHTVGLPINAILDYSMGTPSGWAAYLDPEVNKQLKKILNVWGEYLQSPASAKHLGTDEESWFSPYAKSELEKVANVGKTDLKFEEIYVCDPSKEHHGFKSWDDFFTRHLRPGVREVACPEDDDVIANACESKTFKIAHNVAKRDKFWLKGQPYSLVDMLHHDPLASPFVGGTIYQAFLSALSYHRWHTPVSGIIKKAYVVPGTYYSEPLFENLANPEAHEIDPCGEGTAQAYITHTAARAIIFIQADNPKIGLMAFMGIGMSEVSSCEITVKEGDHINKGDGLGAFHFGGSTHCLLFRKGILLEGFPEPHPEFNVPVRSYLARVK